MVSGRSTIPSSQGCTRHRPSKWVQPCGLVRRWRRDAAHGPSTSAVGSTMRCLTVPLPPYTRDVSYLYAFQAIVPPIARAFRPDVICSQLGADAHYLDPLTHLMLTTETYEAVGRILDGLSSELCGGRWIAVGGGGYDVTAVPRVWTVLFATMVGLRLDDALPTNWLREGNQLVGTVPAEKG